MATDVEMKAMNNQQDKVDIKNSEIKNKSKDNNKDDKKVNVSKTYLIIKRVIDILTGFVGCIIMIPISIVVLILNLANKENGPMYYKQKRIGKDGKIFMMYKYRTMVVNADEILEDYLNNHEKEKEEYILYRKLKNDPRITKIGIFLRRTSLDEWPQFINVFRGEMSLVGARPYLIKERDLLEDNADRILAFRPGLTGPWQIAGRSNLKFSDRIKIETKYVPTFKGDLKIVFATVKKILIRDGAC